MPNNSAHAKNKGCQSEYCAKHSSSHSKFSHGQMPPGHAARQFRWVNAGSTLVPRLVSELPPLGFQTYHTIKEEYPAQNMNKKSASIDMWVTCRLVTQLQQRTLQTHHNHPQTPLLRGAAASKRCSGSNVAIPYIWRSWGCHQFKHYMPAKRQSDAMHAPRVPRLNHSSQLCQGRAVA